MECRERARVAVIELVLEGESLTSNLVLHECEDPDELQRYISTYRKRPANALRRIFLVEWSEGGPKVGAARLGTIRHILETELSVPQDFFVEHASHGIGSCFVPRECDITNPFLISTFVPERRFCVGLFEMWEYMGKTKSLMVSCPISHRKLVPGDAGLILVCRDTARQLQFHQWKKTRKGWLIIAPRKCSYLALGDGRGKGEDVVILVDPTPAFAVPKLPQRKRNRDDSEEPPEPISLKKRQPFLGGYQQFLPRNLATGGELSTLTREVLKFEKPVVEGSSNRAEAAGDGNGSLTKAGGDDMARTAFKDGVQNGTVMEMTPGGNKGKIKKQKRHKWGGKRKEYVDEEEEGPGDSRDIRVCILEGLENTVSPRTSLFDDLRYYFTRHSNALGPLIGERTPFKHRSLLSSSIPVFPLKLIASHYSLLHAFVSFQTASMRSAGWTLMDDTAQQMEESKQVEEAWSRFRCSEYLEAIESLMDSLGIPLYESGSCALTPIETTPLLRRSGTSLSTGPLGTNFSPEPSWLSAVAPDFTFLHRQFTMRRLDYDRITTSIAALASIVMGRVAVKEASSARSLTYVAVLFAPLAWVAAVYSMPDEFAPGRPLFLRYWATALPTTFVVWSLMMIFERRRKLPRIMEVMRRRDLEVGIVGDDRNV
ncbi:hypothetical protein V8F20_009356 [Naviculisporaceae sp. PSN 640]